MSYLLSFQGGGFQVPLSVPNGGTGSTMFIQGSVIFSDGAKLTEDNQNLFYDDSNNRLGIQVSAAPSVALHVAETMGQTISPPATGSASLVAEVSCDVPTDTLSTITAPTVGSGISVTFNYDLGANPATTPDTLLVNAGSGGFVDDGQTINYTITAYKTIGGLKYLHPTATNCSFTAPNNDQNTFNVDIGSVTQWDSVSGANGYILHRSGGGTGSTDGSIDVGAVTSYTDTNFTPTNPSIAGTLYLADGKSWDARVASYKDIGTKYRSDYDETTANVDANDSTAYWTQIDWTAGTGDGQSVGFQFNTNGYVYKNVSIGTIQAKTPIQSFPDSALATFVSVAFPVFLGLNAIINQAANQVDDGSGNFTADGSSWDVQFIPYITIFGVKYYGTPVVSNFTDDGSNNQFYFGTSWDDDGGSYPATGYKIRVQQNGGGYNIGKDVGQASSTFPNYTYNFNDTDTDTTITPLFSSYTGTTRNYRRYGNRLDPFSVTYYSSTGGGSGSGYTDYTYTDTNTVPYVIKHVLSSLGNTANTKILGDNTVPSSTSYPNGRVIPTATTTVYQTNTTFFTTNNTVTPIHYGFQAGTSDFPRSYRVFTRDAVPSGYIYSSTAGVSSYKQIDVADPGGSAYWYVSGSYATVTGNDGFIIKGRTGGTYTQTLTKGTGVTTFDDYASETWAGDVDVSAITDINRVAVLQKSVNSVSDYAILALRTTTSSSSINSGLRLEKSDGSEIAHMYSDSSADLFLEPTASSKNRLWIGPTGTPHTKIQGPDGNNSFTTFNVQNASNYTWSVFKSTGQFIHCRGDTQRVLFNFPSTSESGTPDAKAKFYSTGSTVTSIYAITDSGSTPIMAGNMNGNVVFRVNVDGQVAVATSSSPATNAAHLLIGAGSTSSAPIRLTSGSLLSSGLSGAIEFLTDKYYFSITSGGARKEVTMWDATPAADYNIPFVRNNTNRLDTDTAFSWRDDVHELFCGFTSSQSSRVAVKPKDTTQKGVLVQRYDSTTSAGDLIRVNDDSANEMFSVTSAGKAKGTGSGTTAASFRAVPQSAPSSPEDGDFWNDSTQKSITQYTSGIKQFSSGVLATQTTSVTVANTTTETSLVTGTIVGNLTLPANFFVAGKSIRVRGWGYHSSVSSVSIRIKIKLGSTIVLDTTAVTSGIDTNAMIHIDGIITCRTTGSGGTVFGQGFYQEFGASPTPVQMVNTATTTVNTTTSQAVSVTAQWGTASASDTITLTNFILEVLS